MGGATSGQEPHQLEGSTPQQQPATLGISTGLKHSEVSRMVTMASSSLKVLKYQIELIRNKLHIVCVVNVNIKQHFDNLKGHRFFFKLSLSDKISGMQKLSCDKHLTQCEVCKKDFMESEIHHSLWAIPWWRLWPKFENFSLLIDHSSYDKQAINHFVVDVRSTLGGQSTATPQKIKLGQGQAQCPCNPRWRLWLRTKVGSAAESLQSPISVKCDRVLCQHLYIWWTTYC